MDGDLLVYQQEEVHTIPTSLEELSVTGKLRIIERRNSTVVEWRCAEDEANPDSDWAVVNAAAVTFTHYNTTDSVEITTPRRHIRPISVELCDLRSYKLTPSGSLVLIQRDGTTHPALQFPGKDAEYFVEVLQRYVAVKQSDKDPTLYLLQDKKVADQDARLAALNLVPSAASGAPRRRRPQPPKSRGSGISSRSSPVDASKHSVVSESPSNSPATGTTAVVPWANTPQRVMGFINNFKRDPYTTTLSTLSKFYDNVLFYDWEDGVMSDRTDDEVNPFSSLNFDDLEPGFQVVSLKGKLAERGCVERLAPLTQDDHRLYTDMDRRVLQPGPLRQRIFKGGIHPSLRSELWCRLLGYMPWEASSQEREAVKQQRQQEYDALKAQWRAISQEQETRFTGFRDRKSLIEKDVNRTDRNLPFYAGEDNPNVDLLHNILMTYVMYNFDLGYVQGMSDLLAPILYVTQHESSAFWCFTGYIDMVYRNFDMDQSGMKEQLLGLQQLIAVVDPEFMSYLETKDSANLYFCFRWLLVRFKRELSYMDTLRLWEVLWSGEPCLNFHLLVATAILDHERNTIMENNFGFTEILKHINDTSQNHKLEELLCSAEAIYHQLASSANVPPAILALLGLPQPSEQQEDVCDAALEDEDPAMSTSCSPSTILPSDTAAPVSGDRRSPGRAVRRDDYVLYRHSPAPPTVNSQDAVKSSQSVDCSSFTTVVDDASVAASSSPDDRDNVACSSSNGDETQQRGLIGTVTNILGSAVKHIAAVRSVDDLFEDAISAQFL